MKDKNIDKNKQLIYVVWVGDHCYIGSGKKERIQEIAQNSEGMFMQINSFRKHITNYKM